MANYIIIGGDGKEYGPISSGDVRQWIAEARLNETSLAKAESDAEFRPLGKFPEFADVFGGGSGNAATRPPIQPISGGVDSRALALQKIKTPALGLLIATIINLLMGVCSLFSRVFSPPNLKDIDAQFQSSLQQVNNPQLTDFFLKMVHLIYGPIGIVNILFNLIMATLILMGALKMRSLKNYQFVFTTAVLSVIPCFTPCCGYIVGLAFGIWALVLLKKPEIKSQFD